MTLDWNLTRMATALPPFHTGNMHDTIRRKLGHIQTQRPRVLDLFAGAGGLSLGMQAAGCEIVAAVESEPTRARTHAANFHAKHGRRLQEVHGKARDMTSTDPFDLLAELGLPGGADGIDVIVGGPPCQAYARVGRAKLREVAAAPEAHLADKRGQLWVHYLRYVKALQPVAVIMENVPDILSYGGDNVADLIAEGLESLGYVCKYTLLNAANYGVPQMRERWYLIGIHSAAHVVPSFPEPTHYFNVPPGYLGTRASALAILRNQTASSTSYLAPLPDPKPTLRHAVGCHDAVSDLPPIPEAVKLAGKGPRDLSARVAYGTAPATDYQRQMRGWPGFTTGNDVSAHVVRYLPRDFNTFARMPEGGEYPDAVATAVTLFRERIASMPRSQRPTEGSLEWVALRATIVPPYDPDKFPNKWVKLRHNRPSRTLMAHLSHDSYSHIHYSETEARTISVREAARLQSFPDGFEFCGAMNAAFGQVGNAVPALVARAVGERLITAIRDSASIRSRPARLPSSAFVVAP